MSMIVGAYPAQPEDSRRRFYEELGQVPSIRGLELPYGPWGGQPWPAGAPEGWTAVITAIPGTMQRLKVANAFGLASTDPDGRKAALDFVSGLREYALALADDGHRVEAVELHSAPPLRSSAVFLEQSLKEVLDWDWGDTRVLIEHCDAPRAGGKPEKGFLTFQEELDVTSSLHGQGAGNLGIVINWGRSVIESRNPDTAVEHVAGARAAGVLAGVMFSGCSPVSTEFGYPWIDAHLPAVEVEGAPPGSLLNHGEIRRCLAAAGPVPITGFKIGLPQHGLSIKDRVERLKQMGALIG